jgi:hypothetical protein
MIIRKIYSTFGTLIQTNRLTGPNANIHTLAKKYNAVIENGKSFTIYRDGQKITYTKN